MMIPGLICIAQLMTAVSGFKLIGFNIPSKVDLNLDVRNVYDSLVWYDSGVQANFTSYSTAPILYAKRGQLGSQRPRTALMECVAENSIQSTDKRIVNWPPHVLFKENAGGFLYIDYP
ncbi:hypothetical protein BX070DRAFT_228119 [Coemansia spiralis]|nr:hypothetical protein BX070DRAFT_228119 [Coemansia spiralis]